MLLVDFDAGAPEPSEHSHETTEVENGRFAKLTLPPGMDGAALLQIRDIGSAFDRNMRGARDTNEGASWNVKAHVKTDVRDARQQGSDGLRISGRTRRASIGLVGFALHFNYMTHHRKINSKSSLCSL